MKNKNIFKKKVPSRFLMILLFLFTLSALIIDCSAQTYDWSKSIIEGPDAKTFTLTEKGYMLIDSDGNGEYDQIKKYNGITNEYQKIDPSSLAISIDSYNIPEGKDFSDIESAQYVDNPFSFSSMFGVVLVQGRLASYGKSKSDDYDIIIPGFEAQMIKNDQFAAKKNLTDIVQARTENKENGNIFIVEFQTAGIDYDGLDDSRKIAEPYQSIIGPIEGNPHPKGALDLLMEEFNETTDTENRTISMLGYSTGDLLARDIMTDSNNAAIKIDDYTGLAPILMGGNKIGRLPIVINADKDITVGSKLLKDITYKVPNHQTNITLLLSDTDVSEYFSKENVTSVDGESSKLFSKGTSPGTTSETAAPFAANGPYGNFDKVQAVVFETPQQEGELYTHTGAGPGNMLRDFRNAQEKIPDSPGLQKLKLFQDDNANDDSFFSFPEPVVPNANPTVAPNDHYLVVFNKDTTNAPKNVYPDKMSIYSMPDPQTTGQNITPDDLADQSKYDFVIEPDSLYLGNSDDFFLQHQVSDQDKIKESIRQNGPKRILTEDGKAYDSYEQYQLFLESQYTELVENYDGTDPVALPNATRYLQKLTEIEEYVEAEKSYIQMADKSARTDSNNSLQDSPTASIPSFPQGASQIRKGAIDSSKEITDSESYTDSDSDGESFVIEEEPEPEPLSLEERIKEFNQKAEAGEINKDNFDNYLRSQGADIAAETLHLSDQDALFMQNLINQISDQGAPVVLGEMAADYIKSNFGLELPVLTDDWQEQLRGEAENWLKGTVENFLSETLGEDFDPGELEQRVNGLLDRYGDLLNADDLVQAAITASNRFLEDSVNQQIDMAITGVQDNSLKALLNGFKDTGQVDLNLLKNFATHNTDENTGKLIGEFFKIYGDGSTKSIETNLIAALLMDGDSTKIVGNNFEDKIINAVQYQVNNYVTTIAGELINEQDYNFITNNIFLINDLSTLAQKVLTDPAGFLVGKGEEWVNNEILRLKKENPIIDELADFGENPQQYLEKKAEDFLKSEIDKIAKQNPAVRELIKFSNNPEDYANEVGRDYIENQILKPAQAVLEKIPYASEITNFLTDPEGSVKKMADNIIPGLGSFLSGDITTGAFELMKAGLNMVLPGVGEAIGWLDALSGGGVSNWLGWNSEVEVREVPPPPEQNEELTAVKNYDQFTVKKHEKNESKGFLGLGNKKTIWFTLEGERVVSDQELLKFVNDILVTEKKEPSKVYFKEDGSVSGFANEKAEQEMLIMVEMVRRTPMAFLNDNRIGVVFSAMFTALDQVNTMDSFDPDFFYWRVDQLVVQTFDALVDNGLMSQENKDIFVHEWQKNYDSYYNFREIDGILVKETKNDIYVDPPPEPIVDLDKTPANSYARYMLVEKEKGTINSEPSDYLVQPEKINTLGHVLGLLPLNKFIIPPKTDPTVFFKSGFWEQEQAIPAIIKEDLNLHQYEWVEVPGSGLNDSFVNVVDDFFEKNADIPAEYKGLIEENMGNLPASHFMDGNYEQYLHLIKNIMGEELFIPGNIDSLQTITEGYFEMMAFYKEEIGEEVVDIKDSIGSIPELTPIQENKDRVEAALQRRDEYGDYDYVKDLDEIRNSLGMDRQVEGVRAGGQDSKPMPASIFLLKNLKSKLTNRELCPN